MSNAFASAGGGKKIIDLGTGTSFDVTKYNGYQKFTEANFFTDAISFSNPYWSGSRSDYNLGLNVVKNKKYNASTGILNLSTTVNLMADSFNTNLSSVTSGVHAYLVY